MFLFRKIWQCSSMICSVRLHNYCHLIVQQLRVAEVMAHYSPCDGARVGHVQARRALTFWQGESP